MKTIATLLFLSLILGGCMETVYDSVIAPNIDMQLQRVGYTSDDRKAVERIGKSAIKTMEDITPEQEYYIGRTVAANILTRYRPYQDQSAQAYINTIGNLLTYKSEMPNTYGGYHFMILDSDEVNAFAAPGGFIFVTRGMLRCAQSEDAVAAILAHEIAHIAHQHGLSTIKSSRWTTLGSIVGIEAAKHYSKKEVASLVSVFEESIDDVVSTLFVNGYSRAYEREADKTALKLLGQLGYDETALIGMLKLMDKRLKPGGLDFAKTHPDPQDRIDEIKDIVSSQIQIPPGRQLRYNQALGKI